MYTDEGACGHSLSACFEHVGGVCHQQIQTGKDEADRQAVEVPLRALEGSNSFKNFRDVWGTL